MTVDHADSLAPDAVSIDEAAALAGVCRRTLCYWLTRGLRGRVLGSYLRGSRRMISVAALRDFLDDGEHAA